MWYANNSKSHSEVATSRSLFADYLDVSVETIESYEDSETNGWSFNVLTLDEIDSL